MHLAPRLELLPPAKPQPADLLDDPDALDDLVRRSRLEDNKEHARILEKVKGAVRERRDGVVGEEDLVRVGLRAVARGGVRRCTARRGSGETDRLLEVLPALEPVVLLRRLWRGRRWWWCCRGLLRRPCPRRRRPLRRAANDPLAVRPRPARPLLVSVPEADKSKDEQDLESLWILDVCKTLNVVLLERELGPAAPGRAAGSDLEAGEVDGRIRRA